MLPELGVWDKNSANGMAGAIASTMVLDIMNLVRPLGGVSSPAACGGVLGAAASGGFYALPVPIIPCINASVHRFGGFGLRLDIARDLLAIYWTLSHVVNGHAIAVLPLIAAVAGSPQHSPGCCGW